MTKTTLPTLRDALLAAGWRIDFVSRSGNAASSYYLSRAGSLGHGDQIRISDHALGSKNGEPQGLQWAVNIVVDPNLSLADHLRAVEDEAYRHSGHGFCAGYGFAQFEALGGNELDQLAAMTPEQIARALKSEY